MTSLDLTGRTAIITGASRGIGLAIAQQLAAAGANVVLTARKQEAADEAAARVGEKALGVGAHAVEEDAARRCVELTLDRFGSVDILVNNAGFGVLGAAEESSTAQAQQLFDTNFFGLVRVTREVLPYLRAQRSGRIINIGSVLGFLPAPYGALYSASKHAVEGYSESLDHETREFGVRVSVVEPGYTNTAFEASATDADSPIESYAPVREHVKNILAKSVRAGDDPAVVARVVLKAATDRTPKLRYPAGPLARQLSLLKKYAPAGLLDNGIRKANKLGSAPKSHQVPQKV